MRRTKFHALCKFRQLRPQSPDPCLWQRHFRFQCTPAEYISSDIQLVGHWQWHRYQATLLCFHMNQCYCLTAQYGGYVEILRGWNRSVLPASHPWTHPYFRKPASFVQQVFCISLPVRQSAICFGETRVFRKCSISTLLPVYRLSAHTTSIPPLNTWCRWFYRLSATTGFDRTPTPSRMICIWSPGMMEPTPASVPVIMISPG